MFLSIQADFQLSTMGIGINWTFFINLKALKAIILGIFGVGMCPENLSQNKFFCYVYRGKYLILFIIYLIL